MGKLSIDDLLKALDTNPKTAGKNPSEIWASIANGEDLDAMGFSTEEEKKEWIQNNPYEAL